MTVPLLPLPWQPSWVACEWCGAYLLRDEADDVELWDPNSHRFLLAVRHRDTERCKENLK